MKLRYFAWVRERIGLTDEDVDLPPGVSTEEALRRRRAKARLFRKNAPGGAAVVNADAPAAEILGGLNLDARRGSFGLQRPDQVDVTATI